MSWRSSDQMLRLSTFILLFTLGSCDYYVTDLIVVKGKHAVAPPGFRIIRENLNEGAGGKTLYFATKRGNAQKDAIKDIVIVAGKRKNVSIPADYMRIPTDLNAGTGGDHIYAAFTRNPLKGHPIEEINVLTCDINNFDHCCCDCSYNGQKISTDLNQGTEGKHMFVCYTPDIPYDYE